jgi:SAM-dependent methyltransferase
MTSLEEALDLGRLDAVVSCPVCSSANISPVGKKLTIHPKATSRFSIFSCGDCGHWSTDPLPQQDYLLQLYSEGSLSVYGDGWQKVVSDQFEAKSDAECLGKHGWIVEAEKAQERGNYLEIGPGNCAVLRSFETMNWKCHAIEPGSWSKDRPGFYDSISQLPDLQFDVAVANDVLEHVSDPRALLAEVSRVLKPGARLYSCFPNADSLRARVQRTNWRMVRPIGHVHYFSRRSAEDLLKGCGYNVRMMHTYDLLVDLDLVEIAKSLARLRVKYACRAISDVMLSAAISALGAGDQWRVVAIRD